VVGWGEGELLCCDLLHKNSCCTMTDVCFKCMDDWLVEGRGNWYVCLG